MPSDAVTIVVSTGIGISVIAGVLSGMCYILVHGFKRKRTEETSEWQCSICGIYLRPRFLDDARAILCTQCGERVCKSRCSKRTYIRKGWICYNCSKKASNSDLKMLETKKRKFDGIDTMRINSNFMHSMQKKNHIRDFIENLVSVILGENVDDASVFRIYAHRQYNKLFEKYHQDLCNAISNLSAALHVATNDVPNYVAQSPSTAHSNLKKILEKVERDASQMSSTSEGLENLDCDYKEQTYEELLAAAILNKVISKYQNKLSTADNSISCANLTRDNLHKKDELEWHSDDFETNSSSSLDENAASDSCYSSAKYVDEISLTIQKQVEELYSKISEGNESPEDSLCFLNDSSNWYMQKRLFLTSHSPIPVPMVVPNPLSVSKVLIGEKEIDETSDLSDDGSEAIIKPVLDSADDKMSADSGIKVEGEDRSKFCIDQKSDIENASLNSLYDNSDNKLPYLSESPCLSRTVFKDVSSVQKYGRDYCKRQASLPCGRKKTCEKYEDESSSEDSLLQQQVNLQPAQTDLKTENCKFESEESIPYESNQSYVNVSEAINTFNSKYSETSKANQFKPHVAVQENVDSNNLLNVSETKVPQISSNSNKNKIVFGDSHLQHSNVIEYNQNDLSDDQNAVQEARSTTNNNGEINTRNNIKNDTTGSLISSDAEELVGKCDNLFIKENCSNPRKCDDFYVNSTCSEDENNSNNQFSNYNNVVSSNMFSLEFSDEETYHKPPIYQNHEYCELKEKRLVANRLNDFSKAFPNLVKTSWNVSYKNCFNTNKSTENLEDDDNYISVKNLKKMFENKDSCKKDQPVHSLTARSIPKQIKENLKKFGNS